MSTLNVDNINEYTSGNGVEIPGHIIQVVSATDTTVASYSLSGTTPQKLGSLELDITPKSTSSKIFLSATFHGMVLGRYMAVNFVRGSTKLGDTDTATGSRTNVFMSPNAFENSGSGNQYQTLPTSMEFVDSPNSTSSINYYVGMSRPYGTDTFYYNRPENDTNDSYIYRTRSVFTAMEIAQ